MAVWATILFVNLFFGALNVVTLSQHHNAVTAFVLVGQACLAGFALAMLLEGNRRG